MHGVIRTAYQDTSYFKSFSGSEKGTGVGAVQSFLFFSGLPWNHRTFWYQRPVELRDLWAAAEGRHLGGRVRPSSRDVILCRVPWSEHSSLKLVLSSTTWVSGMRFRPSGLGQGSLPVEPPYWLALSSFKSLLTSYDFYHNIHSVEFNHICTYSLILLSCCSFNVF